MTGERQMVKVELEYNPYLMETHVKFNGRAPRVNSLVEKYQTSKLQDWIREIPDIFYNEMNGYGFELEFTGTRADFEQLKKTFEDQGITEDEVVLFHKSEYESREKKVIEVEQLVNWLATEKRNKLFSFEDFINEYGEKLNEGYTFFTLNRGDSDVNNNVEYKITIEDIDSIDELKDVELKNIPLIVYVTRELVPSLQNIIQELKQRNDISENQIFFVVSDYLNTDRVKRTIHDLGIQKIQDVQSINDPSIINYYYAYPVTDRLHEIICLLRDKSTTTCNEVEKRKRMREGSNKEIHEQIDKIDLMLDNLRGALDYFYGRGNIELPGVCYEAQTKLRKDIEGWRKNKVKFSPEFAEKYAFEFNEKLRYYFNDFVRVVIGSFKELKDSSLSRYRYVYRKTKYDDYKVPLEHESAERFIAPFIMKSFMEAKREKYVLPKADLKDIIFREDGSLKEPELVATYYCQDWREHALDIFLPLANTIIEEKYDSLTDTLDTVAKKYIAHIEGAIEAEKKKKDQISSRLSRAEVELQRDIDWNTTFLESIKRLERA